MIANFIKQSWLVIVSALVFGLLVALVQGQLDPMIKANAEKKLLKSMAGLFLQKAEVTKDDLNSLKVNPVVDPDTQQVLYYKVSKADTLAGYAFEAEGGGFADKIKLLVTLDAQKEKLMGIGILKTNETPGFGDKMKESAFKDQFSGKPVPTLKAKLVVVKRPVEADVEIESITGATISSDAVVKIVNTSVMNIADQLK